MKGTLTGACVAALAAMLMLAARPAESRTAAKAPKAESVTLTGCLHADGNKYVLTEPKGRTWKTAWIMKSNKKVEVMSTSSGPKLKDHVGHEVTLTGVRNGDSHVQAKSIKHVAASCS
jgi:gas vesicle protein